MKIVETGHTSRMFDDDLVVRDELPPAVYAVSQRMDGFVLERVNRPPVPEGKVYGSHMARISKMLNTYDRFGSRSLGVILSGPKGIGKTMCANLAIQEWIDRRHQAVILVKENCPGLADFIDSIRQEVLVVFDEFEKVFPNDPMRNGDNNESNPQNSLLGLFDGLSSQKRLYLLTVNKVSELSTYMLNRPGRFHYHFRFSEPGPDEVREYLTDTCHGEVSDDEIEKVIQFSLRMPLTFDCLRAIAFELRTGEKFQNLIEDLNVDSNRVIREYCFTLVDDKGQVYESRNEPVNFVNPHLDSFVLTVFFSGRDDHGTRIAEIVRGPNSQITVSINYRDLTFNDDGSLSGDRVTTVGKDIRFVTVTGVPVPDGPDKTFMF